MPSSGGSDFGSATFINGDDRLAGVEQGAGGVRTVSQPREKAAAMFNEGAVRFLVSTEAGGEGIDLQERCATLVHVDMPWNPMRLHQRVGRLSRYGQRRSVAAYILCNPDTVEARIWDLLGGENWSACSRRSPPSWSSRRISRSWSLEWPAAALYSTRCSRVRQGRPANS